MREFWRNNGLSLVLLGLFLFSWVGQAVAGLSHYNDQQAQHGQADGYAPDLSDHQRFLGSHV